MLMRCLFAAFTVALALYSAPAPSAPAAAPCPALLDHQFSNLMDEPLSLCRHAGKVVLIVNTASECGYTPQYDGLEKLYRRYRDRGFVVLGFPANDFGGQEPGSNKEIAEFCRSITASPFRCSRKLRSRAQREPAVSRPSGKNRQAAAAGIFINICSTAWDGRRVCSTARSRPRTGGLQHRSKNCSWRSDDSKAYPQAAKTAARRGQRRPNSPAAS